MISKVAVPDGTSEYEVKATLTNPATYDGEFLFYLDATPTAGPNTLAGSFYQIAYAPQSGGYIGVLCVNGGTWSGIASGSYPPHDGMVFRVVRRADGQIIVYVDNHIVLWTKDTTISSGQPGIGMISYQAQTLPVASISQVQLGPCDRIAPNTPAVPSVSVFSSHVDFSWPAVADDPIGTGVGLYQFLRNYSFATNIDALSPLTWSDTTVTPGNIYTYTFIAYDMHFNPSYVSFTVTVPVSPGSPPYAPDGHRIGVRTTGAYWGSRGENIDVLSGNLNFTAPLITAKARGSMSIPINLNYNSQNWRKNPDTSVTKLGYDVGYGYGWRIMAGSMVWFSDGYYGISYWKFTDATGAEYKLTDYNSVSGVWQSRDSVYVWYNPTTNQLYFRDGTFWTFGCMSSSSEPDAGTLYPTQIEDSNGNQILIRYMTGTGAGTTNTSGRIWQVEDVRALVNGHSSFTFSYDSTPKLTSIADNVGSGQSYTFSYYSGTLVAPWGSGTYGTVDYISQASGGVGTFQFTYAGTGYTGELGDVAYPYGGHTTYAYQDVTYGNGYTYRQVYQRGLKPDGVTNLLYTINHETTPGNSTHQYTTIDDAGGVGEKYWAFSQTGVNIGMVTQYQGRSSGVAKTQDDLTWAQDTAGDLYIASTVNTLDPGQTYAMAKRTDQVVDYFGNLTQVLQYAYGNLTAPARIYQYTYLSTTPYQVAHIFNRVTSVTATGSFVPGQPYQVVTLASNTYDAGSTSTTTSTPQEWDTSYSPSYTARGNVTSSSTLTGGATYAYDQTGTVTSTSVNGVGTTISSTGATNFAAPSQVTIGSLSNSMTYDLTSILAPDSVTGPNGASAAWGWDSLGRPASTTSPFGAVTNTSYVLSGGLPSSPGYTTVAVNGRWTKTTFDGFARPTLVETGNGSTTVSKAETQYAPCGCTPLGKMYRTAVPHAPGGTPAWTTYTYDGIGRTLSVQAADGASTTTYLYQGNVVTVTDPAGNWKKYTSDAFGHLTQVNEPNPAGGGGVETVWVEDSVPAGATVGGDNGDSWNWVSSNPSPFSGTLSSQSNLTSGEHQHYFYGATNTLTVNTGDSLIAYVYLDPSNPPTEVMLQWNDGSWEHRAYWGADSISWGGSEGVSHHYMGALPATGQWVRLSVPASSVALEGRPLNGLAFTIYGGRATWDHAGKVSAGGGGGADYVTTYSYDLLDHLIGVSMPRATGTQTRTFNYGSPPGALLLSATNPENGTVSYTYNTGGNQKIATKTDAKGQQTQYSYDTYARLTEVRHYISGTEDLCQRVDFYYDSNPFNGSYSLNASGRLAAVQYQNATINPGFCDTMFQEWYSYNAGGARVGKEMQVIRGGVSLPHALISSYMYDTEGRMTSQQYPDSYTYDYMGNPTVLVAGRH